MAERRGGWRGLGSPASASLFPATAAALDLLLTFLAIVLVCRKPMTRSSRRGMVANRTLSLPRLPWEGETRARKGDSSRGGFAEEQHHCQAQRSVLGCALMLAAHSILPACNRKVRCSHYNSSPYWHSSARFRPLPGHLTHLVPPSRRRDTHT